MGDIETMTENPEGNDLLSKLGQAVSVTLPSTARIFGPQAQMVAVTST
jgi:hypothetical protein